MKTTFSALPWKQAMPVRSWPWQPLELAVAAALVLALAVQAVRFPRTGIIFPRGGSNPPLLFPLVILAITISLNKNKSIIGGTS